MKIKIFGNTHELENLLIIALYLLVLLIIAILIWKLISPILAIILPIVVSYLLYLRKFFGGKR
ncbi:MAG: hypothetical protein HY426_05125 [Candidatus Levybacteria bacterium]|nr:hypothetical protein [Candidatus Levybacteria bacterium]